jgi:hypothetical protein
MTAKANVTRDDREGRNEEELSTFALDVYWAAGRPRDAGVEAHVAGCERCRQYLASLDGLQASAPSAPFVGARPALARRRWALPVAAAGALAMAATFLALVRSRSIEPGAYVGVKGTPAVQLLVHRERETRIWDGRSPVHPGDALALRVACEGLKHVVVASPANGGWVRLSGTACPEHDEPLPFTLKVDSDPGDEQVAVVLSQDEIDDQTLERAISESRRTADVWVVSFLLPKTTETEK